MRSQNNCIGYFHSLFFPYQGNYEQLGISSLHTCTRTISTFNSLLRSEHVRKTFDKHETENNNNILGYMFLSSFFHYSGIPEIIQWQSLVCWMVTSQLMISTSKKELLVILAEAAVRRCSYEKVIWKNATN